MRKLLIVAPFCSLPEEEAFNRFLYLAMILSRKYDVTLLTSSFKHNSKSQRDNVFFNENFKIVKIFEPGYSDNVSFRRVYSHRVFLNNFKKWFGENDNRFDVVYSAYPLIGTNIFLSKSKSAFNYKFKLVIDIQDIWPEAISSAIPLVKYIPLRFLPFTRQADFCYRSADALVSVSKTYLNRALAVSDSKNYKVIYIGSDSDIINNAKPANITGDRLKLVYCGSLGYSYDIKTVLMAVNLLLNEGVEVELHIAGSGRQEKKLKSLAKNNTFFYGFIDFKNMISLIKGCDVGVNSLVASAPQSITNKLSDYFSVGIPILNSQTTPELISLLKNYSHANYKAGEVSSCVEAIKLFVNNPSLTKKAPNINFYRKNCYSEIFEFLENVESS